MIKNFLTGLVVCCLAGALLPTDLAAQYRAEDITVPAGYKITKVAEANRVADPWRLSLDSDGKLIVGAIGFTISKMDWAGQVEVIGKTRKYNITPAEVDRSPLGFYILRGNATVAGARPAIYKFTPPDTYEELFTAVGIRAISFDKKGFFYVALMEGIPNTNPVSYRWVVNRYDPQINFVEAAFSINQFPDPSDRSANFEIDDFTFDSQNNLLILADFSQDNSGVIFKVPAGGADGVPGHNGNATIFSGPSFYWPLNIAIDNADNLYIDEYLRAETDGLSQKYIYGLTRISASGVVSSNLGPEFNSSVGLLWHGGNLYVSELFPGVISKVDLSTYQKTKVTQDYGVNSAGPIAFDSNDALYTLDFRQGYLLRLNDAGLFDRVGAGIGYAQSIASDGSSFYVGSAPMTADPIQILKIDPSNGNRTTVASGIASWRSVAFDSFGRLILNTIINAAQSQFGADIIDMNNGSSTPYLIGLHSGHCIRFDDQQNIYFVEGTGSGIKKVALAKSYDPPRDLSNEPLFYDFVTPGVAPPTIYSFAVNLLEEVLVPRMDSGDLLFCDPAGNVEQLAKGFILPWNASTDRFGSLYVSDSSNGVFKIVHERWTGPAVIKLNHKLTEEIRISTIDNGVRNSLVMQLGNADSDLKNGRFTPAINKIEAFINEVKAQSGKKIPVDLASKWIKAAQDIVKALKEVA